MLDLRKLFFGDNNGKLPPAVAEAVRHWQALPEVALDAPHFHTRYIVVDLHGHAGGGEGRLETVVALGLLQGGRLVPDDALAIDAPADLTDMPALDRQLAAFLTYAGKSPLVTFHAPYVLGTLQKACKARLGVDYAPPCIDLVWLLPSLFDELSSTPQSLDQWLELFGIAAGGRRDAMGNALQLARLFQRLLSRARGQGLDSAQALLDEAQASSYLRRTH